MSNPYFKFKQFTVWHDKCAMKVGTDGVLLGAWASVKDANRLLDIGTGTGLVALMLAQRSLPDARITALEIDKDACEQAKENVLRSPWSNRITVWQGDFREIHFEEKFDVIVSNPPYFVNSLVCPDSQRTMARHTHTLTYEELLKGVSLLLATDGTFTMIMPYEAVDFAKDTGMKYGMYPIRQLNVLTKPGGTPKRALIAFSFHQSPLQTESLLTELSRHQYSDEYISLTKEYYLHM